MVLASCSSKVNKAKQSKQKGRDTDKHKKLKIIPSIKISFQSSNCHIFYVKKMVLAS